MEFGDPPIVTSPRSCWVMVQPSAGCFIHNIGIDIERRQEKWIHDSRSINNTSIYSVLPDKDHNLWEYSWELGIFSPKETISGIGHFLLTLFSAISSAVLHLWWVVPYVMNSKHWGTGIFPIKKNIKFVPKINLSQFLIFKWEK